MTHGECKYAFRILGGCHNPRRLVDAGAVLAGYAACDERCALERESFLSAFCFADDFRQHLESTGSTKGFKGVCWSPMIWWDIDREGDLKCATDDARRLVVTISERFGVADDDLLIFYSGSKGYHVGLPTVLWLPEPSATYHAVTRRFAERVAERAGVSIDTAIYDRVRAFRAPNSRHPKTGRHKRRLSIKELMHLGVDAILKLAEHPASFDLPEPGYRSDQAAADWREASDLFQSAQQAVLKRRDAADGTATLNRATQDFICGGASVGNRHRLLYSAAGNLAEFGCPPALAHSLLTEAALDSGLSPSNVRRQIDCGLATADGLVAQVCQTFGGAVIDTQPPGSKPEEKPKGGAS